MEAIQQFAARTKTQFQTIATSVDGVVQDVADLKAEVLKLQNSPGAITPEDQALLDGIEADVTALASKLGTLDAATANPPVPQP